MRNECEVPGCRATADGMCDSHAERVQKFGHPTEMRRKPPDLPEHLDPIWDEMADQVRQAIGMAGMESLCGQIYRLREAQRKVTEEGMIVADPKGNPSEHPALAVEKAAQDQIRRWIKEFGVR